jgi:hypothetical protein
VTAGVFKTTINLSTPVSLSEETLLATAGWHPTARLGLQVGAGAVLDGRLVTPDGVRHMIAPGIAASVSGSLLALYETRARPFLMLGASLGFSRTSAAGSSLTAFDLRMTVLLGKTFFERLTPYAAGRAFVGPVHWDLLDATGGDAHHYTVGVGLIAHLPWNLSLFVEGMPLGERSISGGTSLAF